MSTSQSIDRTMLQRALDSVSKAPRHSNPNPEVACVITNANNEIIGEGLTQPAGGPHAEVMAIRDAITRGQTTRGATAFVTLEPCFHHGRTGPCCDALIAAGISRVVVTNKDPNPLVSGQGLARMKAEGLSVSVLDDIDPLAVAARELNIGFYSRMVRKTPWVRMKVAASLDGKTALPNGNSQWITSPEARADGHAWRSRACAILTGIGTVVRDRPRLDVRLVTTSRQPSLVIIDSNLRTPLDSPLFMEGRTVIVYCATNDVNKIAALTQKGAQVVYMPDTSKNEGATKRVNLKSVLQDLAKKEFNDLHIEAGSTLNGAFIRDNLVDDLLVYLAPKVLGKGASMADFGPLAQVSESVHSKILTANLVGPDLRILARIIGRDAF